MSRGRGRFDTDIDMEAIRESEREALEHEAEAEVSRPAWAGVGHDDRDRSWYVSQAGTEAVHIRAAGDEHAVVERLTGRYGAWLVDTEDMGLHEFHVAVVEAVAEGGSPKGGIPVDDPDGVAEAGR